MLQRDEHGLTDSAVEHGIESFTTGGDPYNLFPCDRNFAGGSKCGGLSFSSSFLYRNLSDGDPCADKDAP